MDTPQPTSDFDESVAQVMRNLPPVVRNYLSQGKYTVVAKALISKYALRIDQGGVLEKEMMLLLMGIENPDEFTQALIEEAHLSQNIVSSIVQDVNIQIFVPLRDEEMKSKEGNARSVAPQTNVGVPNYSAPRPAGNPGIVLPPRGNYAPPPQSPRYPNQQQDTVNAFVHRVQPPANTAPPSISVIAPPAPKLPVHAPAAPVPASAPNSTAMLNDHEEPHIDFTPLAASPAQPRPAPPPNLPGAFPSPAPAAAKTPPPPSSYSTDPYHEPIE